MKIGINLDGVLTNKTEFQYKYGLKYFKKNIKFVNEYAYSFKSMFNCSNEEESDFWNKYRYKYYSSIIPENGSIECLEKLHENGCQIYLIVDRKYLNSNTIKGSYYRFLLNKWLKSNNIVYDVIIYCNNCLEDKVKVCMENEFDYIIEDSIPYSITLSEFCNILMIDRPYNIGFSYVERVNDFQEILNLINNKMKKKLIKK